MLDDHKWEIPEEYSGKISIEEAKFIFNHAEKLLKETVTDAALIATRATALLSVVALLLTTIVGYNIARFNKSQAFDHITFSSLLCCLYLGLIVAFLYHTIKGWDYYNVGVLPSSIYSSYFFSPQFESNNCKEPSREKHLYLCETEQYDYRIKKNQYANKERWKYFHWSLLALVLTPISFAAFYILSIFLSR